MILYMFRTVLPSIVRSLFPVYSAMVYVIQVCRQLFRKLSTNLYDSRTILVLLDSCITTCMIYTTAECTVNKLLMMDRGTVRNM